MTNYISADLENRARDKQIKINTSMEPTPSISKPDLVTPYMLNFNEIKIPKQKNMYTPKAMNLLRISVEGKRIAAIGYINCTSHTNGIVS